MTQPENPATTDPFQRLVALAGLSPSADPAQLAAMAAQPPTAEIARRDPFFSYDRPQAHGVSTQAVQVPMRDGILLECHLLRPAGPDGEPAPGRFPGILHGFDAYDTRPLVALQAEYYVSRGYVALVASARGSGGSPGRVDPFSHQEQQDCYDLVEWLASQPYSTGKVGQVGTSYGGHAALLAAVSQPPHLITVIAIQAMSDWYRNTIYPGGIPSARIRDWQAATAPDTLATYPQHPLYDEFWRERSVAEHGEKVTIPVLDVGGWLDRYRAAMVENFNARPETTWMVAGPWEHGMWPWQPEDIRLAGYLAWFDHWLTDYPAPLPQARVTSYEMPDAGWRQYPDWPPAGTALASWFPGPEGALQPPGGEAAPASAPALGATVNFAAHRERLTFETESLPGDLVLAGAPRMHLRAAFTANDGDLAVVLEDVAADGAATRVSNGWLKASHRAGHEAALPVEPGTFYGLTVELWPVHHRFAAGHRLRLTVSSDDYPHIDSDAPDGTVSIELGPATVFTVHTRI